MFKTSSIKSPAGPHLFNAALFIITLVLNLQIQFSTSDWKDLADSYDYLKQSKMSLLNGQFYSPGKTKTFSPRPFTIPLFYKLCGSNPTAIVQMQKVVQSLSVFFLVTAFLLLLQKPGSGYLLAAGIYLLTSWWNVLGWSVLLLSESLSTSLFFCWLASFIFLYKKPEGLWWLGHIAFTILLSFTRDSWPYVLICFYSVFAAAWWWFNRTGTAKYAALVLVAVILFFTQQHTARAGFRFRMPVINCVVARILPNPEYLNWFTQQGMPMADKLKANYGNLDIIPVEGQHKLWALNSDTAYQPFLTWVETKGQSTYSRFLITHPSFTLCLHEKPAQLRQILAYNLFYTDEPRGYTAYIDNLFPLFRVRQVLALSMVAALLFIFFRNPVLLIPVMLVFFTFVNAILCYNGDALEVDRHSYLNMILVQLTGFLSIAFIWDAIKWKR